MTVKRSGLHSRLYHRAAVRACAATTYSSRALSDPRLHGVLQDAYPQAQDRGLSPANLAQVAPALGRSHRPRRPGQETATHTRGARGRSTPPGGGIRGWSRHPTTHSKPTSVPCNAGPHHERSGVETQAEGGGTPERGQAPLVRLSFPQTARTPEHCPPRLEETQGGEPSDNRRTRQSVIMPSMETSTPSSGTKEISTEPDFPHFLGPLIDQGLAKHFLAVVPFCYKRKCCCAKRVEQASSPPTWPNCE
ncbi:PREDICTED: uncharacterized protein LOC102003349 [Chinchilla lanigera]|uniref:uncharacterized protein LOC102003349 n=1 Tax=Chinchilla lanigera TaxID=34839 RepID=UPI00038EAF51|nr:PREDICTED: uncharacterized protein LOC102003349 [Chinchilla lanigera]